MAALVIHSRNKSDQALDDRRAFVEVWEKLHQQLLAELKGVDQIDWPRASVDSCSCRALGGGKKTGPSLVSRPKRGSKRHVIVNGQGNPLAATVTAVNDHDVKQLEPLVDAVPPVRGRRGHPRRRPKRLYADRAYDSDPQRKKLRRRRIEPVIARRNEPHGSGLGRIRWVVENAKLVA